jgi:TolB-like protein/class 3 adenylate cyclase/Tfp pilus assembly protein PilF
MSQSRQLAAIMFTDIVGYTALMGNDEQKAFELLKKNRELQKPLIEQFNGRWIKELGDGVMASFHTVTEAVLCASEIQKNCNDISGLQLRIGIHQGEVLFENNDVFGDGVNIASRLQALAPIGSTWISESAYRNITNKKEIKTKFIGAQPLKNVKDPVSVYEIITDQNNNSSNIATMESDKKVPEKSIAVLPFVNMSNDTEQEYFSDGMAEEILNSLAHLKDLKVAGRTSTFQFKGKNIDLREIGEKLNVRTVLEGSIRKQGNKIRITAQLINAEDGYHLWSERYDRQLDDIFAIQDEIALMITEKLKIILLEEDREQITKIYTHNTEAYELYLKGRYEWGKRTKEGFLKSIDYYNQAIHEDQQYGLAYAGIADSYTLLCGYHILSPEASLSKAKIAAEKAMQLNPTLAEAYEATGHIEFLAGFNWENAKDDYKKAIELNPGFATAHQRYALILATQGKYAEALEEIKKALELDPLSKIINTDAGLIYLLMGNSNRAIEKCKEVLNTDPAFYVALFIQGLAYEQIEQAEFAISNFQKAVIASNNNPITLSALGYTLAASGDETEALNILQSLKTLAHEKFISPYCLAVIFAGLGKSDEAFEWLNKAIDRRSVWMIHLHFSVDPRFKEFKNDKRYAELLYRIQMITE